jgi:hypothetical protein
VRFSLATLAILALVIPCAHAQYFSDDFEIYPANTLLHPTTAPVPSNGGWTGWDGTAAAAGTVRAGASLTTGPGGTAIPAHSGNNFIAVGPGGDAVQPFTLNATTTPGSYQNYIPSPPTTSPLGGTASGGVWRLSSWIYVPQSAPTGTAVAYWIVNNVYNHLGPYSWLTQVSMNFSAGGVSLNDANSPFTLGALIVPFDSWFQVRVDYDLTNNCKVTRIFSPATMSQPMVVANGQVLAGAATLTLAISNLDLYSTGATFYVDDVELTQVAPNGTSYFQVNSPSASFDCNGAAGTACMPGVASILVGANGAFYWSSPLTTPYDTAATLEPAYPSAYLTPGNQVVNINLASASLLWVNTLSPVISLQPFPAPGFNFPFVPTVGGLTLTGQMIILDPSVLDSFRLSQAGTLVVP